MPKMVCPTCEVEFRPEKNGVSVIETMNNDRNQPYKIWEADLWKCPGCGALVVAGFGRESVTEHFRENFERILNAIQKTKSVIYDHEMVKGGQCT